jgi:hypothetical protein
MRKIIVAVAILGLVAGAAFGQTLEGFQTAFENFSGDMASSLALNSVTGSNWSDAYIGGFPHFGVGLAVGAAFASPESASTLFDAMGATLPAELESLGVPIPAAGATLKIGLPFLPMDIGLKAGYIPPSVGDKLLSATGVAAEYTNAGIQLRYAVIKQNILLPNISIGASYNYQKGSVKASTGIGSQSFTVTTDEGTDATTVSVSNPDLALAWVSNTFDFTIQASKRILFLIPYVGAGYTIGTSSVDGGVSATVNTTYDGSYGFGIDGLNNFFAANGGPVISDQGFTYSASANAPIFRVYGGLSLRILIDLDAQVMYVPATKALGGSVTTRIQL